jgi:tetratricopeptide (TPR) repeat protein
VGLEIASRLWRFWQFDGRAAEGLRWIQDALDRDPGIAETLRARALIAAGELACVVGDLDVARDVSEASLELCRSLNDLIGTSESLHVLAWSVASRAQTQADFARAARLQRECLELCSLLDDPTGATRALHHLGDIARQLGAYQRPLYAVAETYLAEARRLRIQQGDWQGVAWGAHCLALLDLDRAQLSSALDWANEALTIWRSIEHAPGTAATLSLRARVYAHLRDMTAAIADIRVTLAKWTQLRTPEWLVNDLHGLATVAALGDGGEGLRTSAASLLGAAEALDGLPAPAPHQRERDQLWALLRASAGADQAALAGAQTTGRMQADNAHAMALRLVQELGAMAR